MLIVSESQNYRQETDLQLARRSKKAALILKQAAARPTFKCGTNNVGKEIYFLRHDTYM